MKQAWFFILSAVLIGASCSKPIDRQPSPPPVMKQFSLNETKIRYHGAFLQVDANHDGTVDLVFGVQLVGDPLAKVDKRQFMATSTFYTSLPVTPLEQVTAFHKAETIPVNDFGQSRWYNASGVVLIERAEHVSGTIAWKGNWLTASRHYLPFQVSANNRRYNGWIELTADMANEQLILHRGAISEEAEKDITAGH